MVICLVSSTTVITETSELSLSSAIRSFVIAGSAVRRACGSSTSRSAWARERPSAAAASVWPTGTDPRAARCTSAS
jgi:hypothetical protein